MEKNLKIWNLKEIIQEKIKKYKIDKYKEIENGFEFDIDGLKVQINSKKVEIGSKKYRTFKDLRIEEKKGFFSNDLYVNGVKIKVNKDFFREILNEWKDSKLKTEIPINSHALINYSEKSKEDYLKNLKLKLDLITDYRIKVDKYIYVIGKGLGLKTQTILNILKEKYNIEENTNEFNKEIILDIFNYYYLNNLEIPKVKELKNKRIVKNNEEEKYAKFIEKIILLNKKKLNKFNGRDVILKQIKFYSELKENLVEKEFKDMTEEFKLEFVRDDNEYYGFKFKGQNERIEYPKDIIQEERVKVICEKKEELDFASIIKAKYDENEKKELLKTSFDYKNNLQKKEFEEREDISFPKFKYSDITEKIILGYLEVSKEYLQTNGIWAKQGKRILELRFENFLSELKGISNIDINYILTLKHYKNTEVEENIDISEVYNTNLEDRTLETNDLIVTFPLDTIKLGKDFLGEDEYVALEFTFEIEIEENDLDQKMIFEFPLKIKLLNPEHKNYLTAETATIDFGTSSTCAAINREGARRELLSLELPSEENGERAYENPTNLLIKDWKKFFEIWSKREEETPIIPRYMNINLTTDNGIYCQGHKLKEELKTANKLWLNALVTQLKLIPYKNLTLDEKVNLIPYIVPKVGIKEVELISEYEKQTSEKFDIISFYAYLLGRAILSPLNKKIVTKYSVTVPVKFEENVKKAMLNSIKNGIRLAVPEPLKEKIEVEEGNQEPVAFIGAICKNKKAIENNWKLGSKFAVFDFGGGTIDFSFGRYRKSNEEIEEEADYDNIIEVINTAGDPKGGAEYIIHRLSYYLYVLQKEEMKEKRIPFVIPKEENKIELFPEELQSEPTKPAIYNVNKINEEISRKIFEGKEFEIESTLELQDENGQYRRIELHVEEAILKNYLERILKHHVESFKELLEENFKSEEEIYKNLHIFKAGNASRSEMLKNILEENFKEIIPENNSAIHFIEEESVHGVKPKTAVAIGELILKNGSEIGVIFKNKMIKTEIPFEFNVGYIDSNDDNLFDEIISIGSTEKEWKKLCRANRETKEFVIYYTNSLGEKSINSQKMKIYRAQATDEELTNGNIVWVRPIVANKIEIRIARKRPEMEEKGRELEIPRY